MSVGIADWEADIQRALRDQSLAGRYIANNQREAVDQELGILDYGEAAVTGLYHGAALTAPETYTRVIRRMARTFGASDLDEWATGKLDEYHKLRTEDPYWQPDERWMNSYAAKSLYEGFNSVSNSMALMLPGLVAAAAAPVIIPGAAAAGALTAGTSVGLYLFTGALSGGSLAGMAEYDGFMDEAYEKLHALNPAFTREEIESEQFWNAFASGFAEGGMEFAGDVMGGYLMGLFGKAGLEPARHILAKATRNAVSSVVTEVPSELATAAIQDYIREGAGLDYQGRWQAILNSLGPSLVSAGFGAARGTAGQYMRDAVGNPVAVGEDGKPLPALSPQESRDQLNALAVRMQTAELTDEFGPEAVKFYQDVMLASGMNKEQAKQLLGVGQVLAQQWAERNNTDTGKWWEQRATQTDALQDAGWSPVSSLAQAFVTPDHSFQSIVGDTSGILVQNLRGTQMTAIEEAYSTASDDGGFTLDVDKMSQDFAAWMDNPTDSQVPSEVGDAFRTMRNQLVDTYNVLNRGNAVQISPEAQRLFDKLTNDAAGTRPNRIVQPLVMPKDTAELEAKLKLIATNKPQSNKEIVEALKDGATINIKPWNVGSDIKATVLMLDKELSPLLEPILRRKSDTEQNAEAVKSMKRLGYTEQGVLDLFGDTVGGEEGALSIRVRKAEIYQQLLFQASLDAARTFEAEPSAQNLVQMRTMMNITGHVQMMLRGVRAEIGRTLESYKHNARSNMLDLNRLAAQAEDMGGVQTNLKIARALINADTDDARRVAIEGSLGKKTANMFIEHVTLGMLTAPSTHIVNTVGNAGTLLNEVWSRFLGGRLNTMDGNQGVARGESWVMLQAILHGARQSWKLWGDHRKDSNSLWGALKTIDKMDWGLAADNSLVADGGMLERSLNYSNAREVADAVLPGAESPIPGMSQAHAAVSHGFATAIDFYGRGLGIVSKSLLTADQFFKTLAIHAETHARAYRRAVQDGKGDAAKTQELFQRYAKSPSRADKSAAAEFARRVTFQDDLGGYGTHLNALRADKPLTRLVIPFLKTPINILKYAAAHTPIVASIVDSSRAQLTSPDHAVRQTAEAKVMTGTLLWAGALMAASQGLLTGNGPADPDDRKRLQATGWQPNSVKIGDTYISIDRFDPGAFILNTAASFFEIAKYLDEEDAEKAAITAFGAVMRTITNRSYLRSVQNTMNMIMEPDSPEGQWAIRSLASSAALPASALTRGVARAIDPLQREVDSVFDQIRSNLPGFSLAVPEKRNFLGEIVGSPDATLPGLIAPFRASADKGDMVYSEISRLALSGHEAPGTPQRSWRVGDKSVRLNSKQLADYLQLAGTGYRIGGRTMKEQLNFAIGTASYQQASDTVRARMLKGIVSEYRKAAKSQMLRSDAGVRYVLGL